MNIRKHSVLSDLSFQVMLILMFVAILFLSFDHANLAQNGMILCIVTLLFMITYFTSIRIGFIIDIIFVFLLVAYVVLNAVNSGNKIGTNVYFWLLWPMGMIIFISNYVKHNKLLDLENKQLVRNMEKYVTIDELTQMSNLLGFERDASVYMNISRRYKMELELVLWRLTYKKDLERLLGIKDMRTAIILISDAIKKSLRKEDLVYLVDKDSYIWGTLLFSKPEAAEIVIKHVKDSVSLVNLEGLTKQKSYSLEISGVVVTYDGSMMTSLAFLNKAKSQLWKDESPLEPNVLVELEKQLELEEEALPVQLENPMKLEKTVEVEKPKDLKKLTNKQGNTTNTNVQKITIEDKTIKCENKVKRERTKKSNREDNKSISNHNNTYSYVIFERLGGGKKRNNRATSSSKSKTNIGNEKRNK